MFRFVILDHDFPFPHFDLMLEAGGRLRTWRLFGPPNDSREIRAEALGDHRIEYLDYEGPLSGDRGRVVRWDSGSYAILEESPNRILVMLDGRRCRGTGELREERGGWVWIWHQSRAA